MNDLEAKVFSQHLEKHSPINGCPFCSERNFKLVNKCSIPTANDFNEGYNVYMMMCKNCGYIMSFHSKFVEKI